MQICNLNGKQDAFNFEFTLFSSILVMATENFALLTQYF